MAQIAGGMEESAKTISELDETSSKTELMVQLENSPNDLEMNKNDKTDHPAPPDRFYIIYLLLIFMGLTSLMSTQYIFNANDFWMWKFRNTSRPWNGTADAENRTYLQKSILSFGGVASAIPALASLALIVLIVKRTTTRARITSCYSFYIFIYFIYVILAILDTDKWQIVLMVVTLLTASINSGVFMILVASTITLLPKFPPSYVKVFTLGEGAAGIVTSLIQIICLVIGGSSQTTGLIYFGIAVIVYCLVLTMYSQSRRSAFFRFHVQERNGENSHQSELKKPTLADFKLAFLEIWPVIAIYGCCLLGQNMNNVSGLVVSENSGDGTAWTEKFFVPVVTLLLGNVSGVVGRMFSYNIITPKSQYFLVSLNICLIFVFLPLNIGCNAFPRTLPVYFPHDWQYILILTTFNFMNGFFTTSALLSIPNFMTGQIQKEIYYLMLQITLTVIGIGSAPLNIIVVSYIL